MALSLALQFIEFAEKSYSIDWLAVQQSVSSRLFMIIPKGNFPCDPFTYPSYWYVPILVGNYVGAPEKKVLSDTKDFVTGCVARHYFFDTKLPLAHRGEAFPLSLISDAYRDCSVDSANYEHASFDKRFAAKCRPWLVLLAYGTRSLSQESNQEQYASAMRAIVLVHSCMQFIDDWNDQDEDLHRLHWNVWRQESPEIAMSAIASILRGARASVEDLRSHLLRRVLIAQLGDTEEVLRSIAATFLAPTGIA